METETITLTPRNDSVSSAAMAPFTPPADLDNEELHRAVRVWKARGNLALAALLAHLGEIDARKLYRNKACQSLYTYCVYILRMSEDAAFRRAKAARFVKQHPRLVDALGSGELHLTGLLLLGPHLTDANLDDVLARAKHRSKREIERLVRQDFLLERFGGPDARRSFQPRKPPRPASPGFRASGPRGGS